MVTRLPGRLGAQPADFSSFQARVEARVSLYSPILKELYAYWDSLRDGDGLPSRPQIEPMRIPKLLPYVILTDVEHAPRRFRRRLIGTHITSVVGRDNTGRYFDEIYGADAVGQMEAAYSVPVDERRPVRMVGNCGYLDRSWLTYEALHLPLSWDGDRVNMLLGGVVFDLHSG